MEGNKHGLKQQDVQPPPPSQSNVHPTDHTIPHHTQYNSPYPHLTSCSSWSRVRRFSPTGFSRRRVAWKPGGLNLEPGTSCRLTKRHVGVEEGGVTKRHVGVEEGGVCCGGCESDFTIHRLRTMPSKPLICGDSKKSTHEMYK